MSGVAGPLYKKHRFETDHTYARDVINSKCYTRIYSFYGSISGWFIASYYKDQYNGFVKILGKTENVELIKNEIDNFCKDNKILIIDDEDQFKKVKLLL